MKHSAEEGDVVSLTVPPTSLNFPEKVNEDATMPVTGTYEGPNTDGVKVEIPHEGRIATFRIPHALYEIAERGGVEA